MLLSIEQVAKYVSLGDHARSRTSPSCPLKMDTVFQTSKLFFSNAEFVTAFPEYLVTSFQIMMTLSSPPDAKKRPELLHRTQLTQAKQKRTL